MTNDIEIPLNSKRLLVATAEPDGRRGGQERAFDGAIDPNRK
jgi:hypothetical protein